MTSQNFQELSLVRLFEKYLSVPVASGNHDLIRHFERALSFRLSEHEIPIRFAVTSVDDKDGAVVCRKELGRRKCSDVSR